MIQNTAEILKTNKKEGMNIEEIRQEVTNMKEEVVTDATEAEETARSLELELMEAQAAHERKEEAERSGREVKEKMQELTG